MVVAEVEALGEVAGVEALGVVAGVEALGVVAGVEALGVVAGVVEALDALVEDCVTGEVEGAAVVVKGGALPPAVEAAGVLGEVEGCERDPEEAFDEGFDEEGDVTAPDATPSPSRGK